MARQTPPAPERPAQDQTNESGTPTTPSPPQSGPSDEQPLRAKLHAIGKSVERGWHAASGSVARAVGQHPRGWRAVAIAMAIAGVLAILVGLQGGQTQGPQVIAPDTHRFFVSGPPVLVFERQIGSVHILPGLDGQVTIKENQNGITDAITMHYSQQADTITVAVDIQEGLFQDTWVDFDVSVPQKAGFTATVATGTLDATGLGGHIVLSGTNGSIWATNLTGVISLKTQSGSINLTNVTAQVNAATQNGTITTTATELDGHSTVQAESGTINFHGTVGRSGQALFQNTNGAVNLTLPPKSAFALEAVSANGSINTDFVGLAIIHRNGQTEAYGAVGSGAKPPLTIHTAGGSIGIFQGT
jgi:hypothetical protein